MNPFRPVRASPILLVDDHPDSAKSMAQLLGLWGYQSLVALDGITGLAMALSQRPAVIFLDIRLKGMNGLEVARRIRAEPGMAKTPLLALTGCGRGCDRQASLEAGFDHHLVKPVDLEELRHLLAELMMASPVTLSPSFAAARGWTDGRLVPLGKVVRQKFQWADLSPAGNALGARP